MERYLPKVLLILGYSDSDIIKYGIEQALGSETPPLATRRELSVKSKWLLSAVHSRAREVLHGVGADGVGVKFPIFAVNCRCLPLSFGRSREKRRKRGEKCIEKGGKMRLEKGGKYALKKGENHSDPIYTNPITPTPSTPTPLRTSQ